MAETNRQKFQLFVVNELPTTKDKLLESGLEPWHTKDAINELRHLVQLVGNKYFGNFGEGHRFSYVQAYPLLNDISRRWYKTFMRRMIARCAVRNPWRVVLTEYLNRDLFKILEEVVYRTKYGIVCKTTSKQVFIVFMKAARVRHVFCELMGTDISAPEFLKKLARGKRKVEAIVDEDKQFAVTFNKEKQTITFDFYYGLWNQYGLPQHV